MISAGQRRTGLTLAGCVLAALGLTTARTVAVEAPEVVKTAIEKSFPGATIKETEREREKTVLYYEVEIVWKGQELEVEVAMDGALGEVTQEIKEADLPATVAAKIKALVGAGQIKEIERTEVRGLPKGTSFAPQTPAKTIYEIKYTDTVRKRTVEVRLSATGDPIPAGDDDDDDGDDDDGDDD